MTHTNRTRRQQQATRRTQSRSVVRCLAANVAMLVAMLTAVLVAAPATVDTFTVLPTRANRRITGTWTSFSLLVAKSGGKEIVTEQQFDDIVLSESKTKKPVMVFFTAPWCGPCRLSTPVVKDIMKQFSRDIQVVEVCTDDLAEVASECGVTSIPTIQFYFGGQLLDTIVGCVAKSVLASAVSKVLEDVAVLDKSTR